MDKIVVTEKLKSLNRCLERIKVNAPSIIADLKNDIDKQDIINLNLQRAIQISVDIASHILAEDFNEQSKTMSNVFLKLSEKNILEKVLAEKLAKSVGFGNVAVHEYTTIDIKILYAIITKDLDCFYEFARVILKSLNQ